jgi:hypothetical protein
MSAHSFVHPFLSWSQQQSLRKLAQELSKDAGLTLYYDEAVTRSIVGLFSGSISFLNVKDQNVKIGLFQDKDFSCIFGAVTAHIVPAENGIFALLRINRSYLEQRFTSPSGGFDAAAAQKFQCALIAMLGIDPRKVEFESGIVRN